MSKSNPNYKLTGLNSLAYLGVTPRSPTQLLISRRDPTPNDLNFNIGTLWVERSTEDIYACE